METEEEAVVESCRDAWTGKTPSSAFSCLNSPSMPHLQKQHHLFESKCASRRSFAAGWEGNVGVAAGELVGACGKCCHAGKKRTSQGAELGDDACVSGL